MWPMLSALALLLAWRAEWQHNRVHEYRIRIGAKWLELLKEVAPGVTRVGVIRDPAATSSIGQFGAIQSVAPSFGVE